MKAKTTKNVVIAETVSDFYIILSYTERAKTAKNRKFAKKADEEISMNKDEIIRNLPDGTCSRQQILYAAQRVEPSFKETQLRYLMGALQDSEVIVRVGRNQYKKAGKEPKKSIFTGAYSPVALQVIQYIQERFPLLSYRAWELSWLNEFFNHQLAHNQIIVEVEKDGCDFVFSSLVEKFPGRVLLRPKAQEILHYGIDDGIIVDRLVTDAPKSDGEPSQVPLERLIVDLFANKNLMLSKGDYPSAIEMMFAKYRIDQVSMLRYARRRNKVKDVFGFLRDKTAIELMVQG